MADLENTIVERQLVIFDLASGLYGVDIESVKEIIRMQETTKVPRTPEFVEGIINLRGKVDPVVDLRRRLSLPVGEQNEANRIVVVDIGGQDIGFVVDAVTEVLRITSDAVEPPSQVITDTGSEYLMGIAKVGGKLIILVDLTKVLSELELTSLEDLAAVPA